MAQSKTSAMQVPQINASATSIDTKAAVASTESAAEAILDDVRPVAAEESAKVATAPAAPDHKDIGQWEATYWRGRAIWRHRRTKQTMFKRAEVWRLRNLK